MQHGRAARRARMAAFGLSVSLGLSGGLAACASGHPKETGDALTDMNNAEITTGRRTAAIRAAWAGVEQGEFDRPLTRRALRDLAWNRTEPDEVRLEALRILMDDPTPEGQADSRDIVRLMLPHEESRGVVELLSNAAVRNGWQDATVALVRALSRPLPKLEKEAAPRVEAAAIRALNQGRSIQEVAFAVFVDPQAPGVEWSDRYAQNAREDAWDLLAQIDPTGAERRAMVRAHAAGDPTVAIVARAERELGIVPITGDELTWLLSLAREGDARAARWWGQVSSVVGGLSADRRQGLLLRHLEPIRWASEHRPSWMAADRAALLAELEGRLAGRSTQRRTSDLGDFGRPSADRLRDHRDRLSWADLVVILAIDDALRDPMVRQAMAGQVSVDRADKTTEYGGVLDTTSDGRGFAALPFPPRPSERQHDRMFVASIDMVAAGRMALSQYHFHVQKPKNAAFAGPGEGDLLSAARSGRNNLVLTSIDVRTLNADFYQPDGVVLDLGNLPLPELAP